MLTNELMRFKIDNSTISPRYLTRKHANYYLTIAQKLIHLYQDHLGKTRGELDRALDAYEEDRVGYKILRGLCKVLDGFAEFEPNQDFEYSDIRKQFFEFVEKFRPVVRHADLVHQNTRELVLNRFSEEMAALPNYLYGDLPDQQVLVKMEQKSEPDELIRRYNLALAQGILYRCKQMHVKVWDSYKIVFQYLKLAQLIHKIQKEGDAYHILIDGPFSLFRKTQKYGVNLARFLPALLLAQKWQMTAYVNTEKGQRNFYLDQDCGLTSYYKRDKPFDSSIEEAFYHGFQKRETDWEIQREGEVLDLGETVLIPDFKFTHPGGGIVLLEIVGFWTPEYLHKKLDKIKKANRKDMIVAVKESLNCSKGDFVGPVIFIKTRLKVGEVLKLLNDNIKR